MLNNSGFAKSYVVFMQLPQVTKTGGQPKVFANAWATFNSILPGGYDRVVYTDTTFAFWATTPTELAPGVILSSGGSTPADTAKQDSVPFVGSIPNGFGKVTSGSAKTGSYAIVSKSDFTKANNYVFGMAKAGSTPIPVPVATFLAEPNDTFNVTPVVKFYVADGAYTSGEVIDYSAASTNAGNIDFTGLPQTTVTVTQNSDGSFTPNTASGSHSRPPATMPPFRNDPARAASPNAPRLSARSADGRQGIACRVHV